MQRFSRDSLCGLSKCLALTRAVSRSRHLLATPRHNSACRPPRVYAATCSACATASCTRAVYSWIRLSAHAWLGTRQGKLWQAKLMRGWQARNWEGGGRRKLTSGVMPGSYVYPVRWSARRRSKVCSCAVSIGIVRAAMGCASSVLLGVWACSCASCMLCTQPPWRTITSSEQALWLPSRASGVGRAAKALCAVTSLDLGWRVRTWVTV